MTTISPSRLPNRGIEIRTEAGMPADVSRPVISMLREYAAFLPPWVQFVTVAFEANKTSWDAQTSCQPEYRRARITVTGHWLNWDDRYRRQIVLHEIAHVWTWAMTAALHDTLRTLIRDPDDPVRRIATSKFDDADEYVAEQLAWLLLGMAEKGAHR